MSIKIDKNVPISEFYMARYRKLGNHKASRKPLKYPFKDMEIGDSFLMPSSMTPRGFQQCASTYSMRLRKKFFILRDDSNQWRCYRMPDDFDPWADE